ncbi:MAG: hypothetical protein LDL10_00935 [Calditerrivibrio sp.]|nr:hypothetical protein [Calditerrivibrio sp.]
MKTKIWKITDLIDKDSRWHIYRQIDKDIDEVNVKIIEQDQQWIDEKIDIIINNHLNGNDLIRAFCTEWIYYYGISKNSKLQYDNYNHEIFYFDRNEKIVIEFELLYEKEDEPECNIWIYTTNKELITKKIS